MRLVADIRGDTNDTDFYRVCGLKPLPKLMRIRLLDTALRQRCGGLGDITAPIEEIAQLDIGIDTVLILENLQTGLALGDLPGTAAIMGLGYGVEVLSRLPWVVAARKAVYWGDLDTHGFAILNRARTHVPQLNSILMDEATLQKHHLLWGAEDRPHAALEFDKLTVDEHRVYNWFRSTAGAQKRLEQERITWEWAMCLINEVSGKDLKGHNSNSHHS